MSQWRVLPGADAAAAARFADLDAVFALEGEIVAKDSTTRTVRVEVNGRRYYVKRYHGLGKKPLRRWFGTPRVMAGITAFFPFNAISTAALPTA